MRAVLQNDLTLAQDECARMKSAVAALQDHVKESAVKMLSMEQELVTYHQVQNLRVTYQQVTYQQVQ